MKIPLFHALLDIQNLTRMSPNVHFTQNVRLHIINNQLELPAHVTLKATPESNITTAFQTQLKQLLRIYETVLFAVTIEQNEHSTTVRLDDSDDELYRIGTADLSNTHYVFGLTVTDTLIQKTALLPIGKQHPKGYVPPMATTLNEAIAHFNQALLLA